ncbi:MAG: hypothetical protein D6747_08820 [Chlorobiota bacterium]|nr:MAG: hypothetical protein D6747_08820 [Chlorobiota bacterium]
MIRMFLILVTTSAIAIAQCTDELLLDGSEPLVEAQLDTTGLWWAITAPYAGQQRLVINGYRNASYDRVGRPVLSAEGNHWAAWVQRAGMWELLVDTVTIPVRCAQPTALVFAPNAAVVAIGCMEGSAEIIAHRDKQYTAVRRISGLLLSPDGAHIAWTEKLQQQQRLIVDGREVATADEFLLAGFWSNQRPLYAQRAGGQWRIMRDTEHVAGPFESVRAINVNRTGTAAVAHVQNLGWHLVLLLGEDYNRPLPSQQYDSVWSVVLHPYMPQYGALASRQGTFFLLHSGTEYGIGRFPLERVSFTPEGSELYGLGCDVDCFLVLDGQRLPLGQDLSPAQVIARRPGSKTFSYGTPTNLFVRRTDKATFTYSRMCDAVLPPIYNRRRGRYEALGIVQGRLYLLSCL